MPKGSTKAEARKVLREIEDQVEKRMWMPSKKIPIFSDVVNITTLRKIIVTFNQMRHTYASLLIEQGENIKYIQNQLGHASATFTLNVYGHLMKPVNQEAACRLEKAVFKASGDQMETEAEKGVVV